MCQFLSLNAYYIHRSLNKITVSDSNSDAIPVILDTAMTSADFNKKLDEAAVTIIAPMPEMPPKIQETNQITSHTIRVLQFNILADCWVNLSGDGGQYYYSENKDKKNNVDLSLLELEKRIPLILRQIAEAQADIVCLQEVEISQAGAQNTVYAALEKKFRAEFEFLDPALNPKTSAKHPNGVMILLRRGKFVDIRTTSVFLLDQTAASIVECTHAKSQSRLVIAACHLDADNGPGQGTDLFKRLLDFADTPTIVCGDFNMPPSETEPREFFDRLKTHGFDDTLGFDDSVHTQHLAWRPSDRRDYILVKNLGVNTAEAKAPTSASQMGRCVDNLRTVGSDHSPVVAVLRIAGTPSDTRSSTSSASGRSAMLNEEETQPTHATELDGIWVFGPSDTAGDLPEIELCTPILDEHGSVHALRDMIKSIIQKRVAAQHLQCTNISVKELNGGSVGHPIFSGASHLQGGIPSLLGLGSLLLPSSFFFLLTPK